jgi:hypothetical protein
MLFQVTVLPAHPEPGQLTRVVVHVKRLSTGKSYLGDLRYRIAEKLWIWEGDTLLDRVQLPTDGRYVQSAEFPAAGGYVVRLEATDSAGAHSAEISISVGTQVGWWKYAAGLLVLGLGIWVVRRAGKNRKRLRPV